MSIVKNTFSAVAVSITALFNLASAQNNQIVFNTNEEHTIEVTYTSEVPKYISIEVCGEEYKNTISVGAYARVSNVSNNDGTCTATYDVDQILSSGSGELFAKAYYTANHINVLDGKMSNPYIQVLFTVDNEDIIRNN
jgi:hypothetical protein